MPRSLRPPIMQFHSQADKRQNRKAGRLTINLSMVKNLLWFCTVLLLALAFPMQVYTKNPYPSLLPYLLIVLIILTILLSPKKGISNEINLRQNSNINLMVVIYVFLLLLNTAWQVFFGVINFDEGISALVIYFLPIVFYWYFRRIASEQEIRAVLLAIVIASIIVGGYFVYDSYLKLALGQVSEYANEAFQYSVYRADRPMEEVNPMRVLYGSRSYGLLESHSVSGAWVVLGALAALALLPPNRKVFRRAIVLVFGTMLLLGLNFANIIAFSIIMFLFEFNGLSLLSGKVSARSIGSLVSFALIVSLMVGGTVLMVGGDMSEFILRSLSMQIDLLLGTGDLNIGMVGIAIECIEGYLQHIFNFPLTLLLGDGFSSYGLAKGGDIGYVESLAKFGLPFFFAVVIGLLGLIKSGLRQIKAMNDRPPTAREGLDPRRILQFAICVTLLVLITEGHYTVWAAKSILPIVFFVIALYGRYLSVSRH